jgi:hypothetical protein
MLLVRSASGLSWRRSGALGSALPFSGTKGPDFEAKVDRRYRGPL